MSQENFNTQAATNITLVSDCKSFHSTLLAQYIATRHNAVCTIVSTRDVVPANSDLVLVDCLQASSDTLAQVLRTLSSTSESPATALLNAEHNEDHEALLDWPCISGIFYFETEEEQLSRGIKQLLDGDYWVPRRLLHHFFTKHRQSSSRGSVVPTSTIQLTAREREILRMIKDGMSNSDVSDSLGLSEHTVKSHLYNIYKKIGVRNRMEASNWARDQQDIDAL